MKSEHRTEERKRCLKLNARKSLGLKLHKEYLNTPSPASISHWLKASLTQNSEELILDEAPELFILICRIETPHHREDTKMAAMWCAELRQKYKKPVRFYTTPVRLFMLLRPRGRLPEGFAIWDAFQRGKIMLIDARQLRKKSTLWQRLDVLYCCH